MNMTSKVIDKISQRLKSQLQPYQEAVWHRYWKYLPDVVVSLLKDSFIFVAQAARHLGGDLVTVEKQLLRIFHSPKTSWESLIKIHLKRLKSYLSQMTFDKLLIYADLSDLAKRFAEKMPDLDRIRDGSESSRRHPKTQPGYWLNEVYVWLPGHKIFSAILYPFSTLEKGFRSQTQLIMTHISLVFETLGNMGLWISDRGYDNLKFFCVSSPAIGNFLSASESIRKTAAS